jgi:hypothetical protein
MEWRFKKLARDDTKTNPSHVNFFRDEKLDSEADSLVREDIQNRLDAAANKSKPVRVRYRVSGADESLTGDEKNQWLEDLPSHVNAKAVEGDLPFNPPMNEAMNFLTIEDFETNGLRGDWNTFDDPPETEDHDERNDFYWFIRNVGRSAKRKNDRGRWGLGKIVYPACSRIRSFYAFSVTKNDSRAFLIGRSVLPIHSFENGDWFCSEGYFGRFNGEDDFCTPVDDPDHLEDFQTEFKLERSFDKAGTTLVIPFPVEGISAHSISEAVARYYFWEIINGRLIVDVESPEESFHFDTSTLRDQIAHLESDTFDPEKMLALFDFAKEAADFDYKSERYFELKDTTLNWKEGESWIEESARENAKTAFNEGEQIMFDIPVTVKKKGGTPQQSNFQVYLQSDPDLRGSEEVFIRDGLTIAGQKVLRQNGVRSLVIAEDGPIAVLLGDSENPAHTRWIGSDVKNKYTSGHLVVSFVRNASRNLVNLLTGADEERDEDLLASVFGLPLDEPPIKRRRGPKKKKVLPPNPNPVPVDTPFYTVEKFHDGFQLRCSPKDTKADTRDYSKLVIKVRCAYDGTKNPLNDHSPFDFDITDPTSINIETTDCSPEYVSANEIRILPESKDFLVKVSGFDTNRDLLIKTKRENSESDEEEESETVATAAI